VGYSKERVIYSTCPGIIKSILDIGDVVEKGDGIAYIDPRVYEKYTHK